MKHTPLFFKQLKQNKTMAKINIRDMEFINYSLNVVDLPNHSILDYDIVTFKNGRSKFSPKIEILVVRSLEANQPAGRGLKVSYTTFYIKRDTLCNSIESLIKQ